MTNIPPQRHYVPDLPVWETVTTTYGSVFGRNLLYLPKAVAFPLALDVAIIVLLGLFGIDVVTVAIAGYMTGQLLELFLLNGLELIPYVLFCVAWHRLILFGRDAGDPPLIPGWHRRHWLFLLGFILLAVMLVVVFAVYSIVALLLGGLGPLATLVLLLLLVLGIVLFLRVALIFPAIAVEAGYDVDRVLSYTKGQGLRLLAAAAIIYLPVIVFAVSVNLLSKWLLVEILADRPLTDSIVRIVVEVALLLVGHSITRYFEIAIGVSLLSVAFRFCTGWRPRSEQPEESS